MVLVSRASALRSAMKKCSAQEELDILAEKFPDEPVIYRIKADLLGDKSTKDALPDYEKAFNYQSNKRELQTLRFNGI